MHTPAAELFPPVAVHAVREGDRVRMTVTTSPSAGGNAVDKGGNAQIPATSTWSP